MKGYAKALNMGIREGGIIGDNLFITPQYLFTPHCLERLQHTLTKEKTGIAMPVSNGFYEDQRPVQDIVSFSRQCRRLIR